MPLFADLQPLRRGFDPSLRCRPRLGALGVANRPLRPLDQARNRRPALAGFYLQAGAQQRGFDDIGSSHLDPTLLEDVGRRFRVLGS